MDSFEHLIGSLLEKQGYWVKTGFKVELTPADKGKIKKPTSPRWEIDLLAYQPGTQRLLVVECKSFLDSRGVVFKDLSSKSDKKGGRYKLFTDKDLRSVVLKRLRKQLVKDGLCARLPSVTLCLAAGKIATDKDQENIQKHFDKNGWRLFHEKWIIDELEKISGQGYENEVAAVVAKILLRNPRKQNNLPE